MTVACGKDVTRYGSGGEGCNQLWQWGGKDVTSYGSVGAKDVVNQSMESCVQTWSWLLQ